LKDRNSRGSCDEISRLWPPNRCVLLAMPYLLLVTLVLPQQAHRKFQLEFSSKAAVRRRPPTYV